MSGTSGGTSAGADGGEPRAGATRGRVLDVAERHLAVGGYLGVSLEEVAREVGVSKAALYYHFPDGKEELFTELSHRSLERIRAGIEASIGGQESGAERLRAVARWLVDEHDRGHPLRELRELPRFLGEENRRGISEGFFESHYRPVRRVIVQAVASGEFRSADPDFSAWAFLGLIAGMIDVRDIPRTPDAAPDLPDHTPHESATALADLFLHGVVAQS